MKTVPIKNVGDPYTAEEFNELVSQELQNSALSSGQTLDEGDEFQLGQAMAVYAGAGDFYTDSGIVNAYVLSPTNIQQAPPAYTNGLRARFVATNTNTSNSTANLNALGDKSIKENGIEIIAGRIVAGEIIEISFLSSTDEFELIPLHPKTSSILDLDTSGAEVIDTMTFDGNGHVENVFLRTLTNSDIGAEPAFAKNTAFNKNFGTSAGTVLEGNSSIGSVDSVNSGTNVTITGPATDPIVNVANSTTSVRGAIELATSAEVQAGTDTTRSVTPSGLSSRTATTTRTGLAELATNSEVQTGTDTTRIVTPSGLDSIFSAQAGNPGFFRVQIGGLDFAIQFGEVLVPSNTTNQTLILPLAFTTGDYGLSVTYESTGLNDQDNVMVNTKLAGSFNFTNGRSNSVLVSWIACGLV